MLYTIYAIYILVCLSGAKLLFELVCPSLSHGCNHFLICPKNVEVKK